MQIIINKLLFGMHWKTALSDNQKEINTMVAAEKATAYAIVTAGGQRTFGFSQLKKSTKAKSAAAVVAHIFGQTGGVFLHQISPDLCAFIGVESGMPVEDQVGPRDQMMKEARAFIAEHFEAGTIVSGDIDSEDFTKVEAFDIAQLAVEFGQVGKIIGVSSVGTKIAIGVAAVVVATLLVFWSDIEQAISPPKPLPAVATPQDKYRQLVSNALAEVGKAGLFRSSVMPPFIAMADSLPFSAPGWLFESIKCAGADCVATWKRMKGGNAEGILDALNVGPKDASVSFPSVDKLQKKLTFAAAAQGQVVELSENATLDPKVLTWVQDLKDRGFEPKYSSATPLVPPETGFSPAKESIALVGDYVIEIPYRDIKDVANMPNSMTIDHVEINVQDNKRIVATIRGKYYAH